MVHWCRTSPVIRSRSNPFSAFKISRHRPDSSSLRNRFMAKQSWTLHRRPDVSSHRSRSTIFETHFLQPHLNRSAHPTLPHHHRRHPPQSNHKVSFIFIVPFYLALCFYYIVVRAKFHFGLNWTKIAPDSIVFSTLSNHHAHFLWLLFSHLSLFFSWLARDVFCDKKSRANSHKTGTIELNCFVRGKKVRFWGMIRFIALHGA